MNDLTLQLTECPRDAIQGFKKFIPTNYKIKWLQLLCKVGFDVLDMGSFVSPKAVPQLSDTGAVLKAFHKKDKLTTKFLVIVANERGIKEACKYELVDLLGYPFSVSEIFQQKNTNHSRNESLDQIKSLLDHCARYNKKSRVYLSMAFGNPYGESWNNSMSIEWTEKLISLGVNEIALSDTTGNANQESIKEQFIYFKKNHPAVLFSAHFHSKPEESLTKIQAAFDAGCIAFDTALNGIGGCPFAKDELTGNISTQNLCNHFNKLLSDQFDWQKLNDAVLFAQENIYINA